MGYVNTRMRAKNSNATEMGKKGSWFSAIKRVFIHHSKEKVVNDSEKKNTKEKKKKGLGKLRHGETNSFIPLFREPSSIEKIFGDFEREQQLLTFRPPTPPELPKTPPFVPPRAASPRAPSPRAPSPQVASPRIVHHHRPEPTLRNHHASATKIQAAYRGYMARRSFRALKGLVRLQGVVRGQNVKRQTMNAMKYMQLLVRVQSQIQSRRIQMLENQARYQAEYKNDKDVASTLGKLTLGHASEAGNHEDWDDSLLTKEEIEARLQRKVEAIIKRERAMAYAYSHQLWKGTPTATQAPVSDIRSGGFPWWWNWLERQLPSSNPQESQVLKNFQVTPTRPYSEQKTSPRVAPPSSHKMQHYGFDNMDTATPKSTKSAVVASGKSARSPQLQANSSKYSRAFDVPLKDDDSLTSCPPFSVPNYMAPTLSARAKVRASSNPRESLPGTPNSESKRRLSFPGSLKWSKPSFFSTKDPRSQRMLDKNQSLQSLGNLSVDSTVSLPTGVGRKPFNRFV
ncbi:protein IQ-DOMAIN 14 isoform X1 [Senna tora]|uniref:Protein IQ-DOMAIN 14 isoform X1 n=1 Tax=Senna tora TaxID=362788 RepID=A0A834W135_9FABA|nr:protein IQ-DOMAIN 14 isoform X1 [Senna tora]